MPCLAADVRVRTAFHESEAKFLDRRSISVTPHKAEERVCVLRMVWDQAKYTI